MKHKQLQPIQPEVQVEALRPIVMMPTSYQPAMETSLRPTHLKWRQRHKKLWRTLILTPAVVLLLSGAFIGWKLFVNSSRAANGNALGFLVASALNGEDKGRVNILLTGNSSDDPGHSGSQLTDSIMIISIDIQNKNAYLLSIPRDFYVRIEGHGYSKINAAYVYGEQDHFQASGYPDGGIGLLEQTLEQTTGVHIDQYALINFGAFRDAVNAVGGIDINIQSSDPRGIFDPNINNAEGGPVKLTNGVHHLNGQQALNLSRARNDPPPDGRIPYGLPRGDYDRTANQRLMLVALKDKVSSIGTISNPLKVGKLLDGFGNNVKTDMKTSQLRRLYDLLKGTDSNNIQSLSLSDPDKGVTLIKGATINGSSTQIPSAGLGEYDDIQAYITQVNAASKPKTTK